MSAHAIERYRRRVEDVSDAEAICRVILAGDYIITVVPKSSKKRRVRKSPETR